MNSADILLVDDDEESSQALIRSLSRKEKTFNFIYASNSEQALSKIKLKSPEVAIVDLSLDPSKGPESGLQLLGEILSIDSSIRILVLTGHDSEEFGIKALHSGAASFIQKPADSEHLIALIRDSVSFAQLRREFKSLNQEQEELSVHLGVSTKSRAMQKALQGAAFAASNNRPILLVGQTGTGKGVLSQAIHNAHQRRTKSNGLFIRFQASFLSSDLVASELFGHKKGAFTGADTERKGLIEEADGGTLFIDEVDELPHDVQVMLLNVLQEKKFRKLGSTKEITSNFRLITATNRPIENLVDENKLRRDFYHRIAHAVITLPPLNQRLEDIPLLSRHFIYQLETKENIGVQGISEDAVGLLTRHNWPGNIRELQSTVEGAAYLAAYREKHIVDASDLDINSKKESKNDKNSFREKIKNYELKLVKDALQECDNNQSQAASLLKLDRSSLRRILKRDSN